MKAPMISIKPIWMAKILNGEKIIEVRKNKALASAIQKLIDENGYADIYVYCSKDVKNLLHKNCVDIYWIEDKDFRNKNKQLGLQTQPILNGKVLFKFRCYKVEEITPQMWTPKIEHEITEKSCLKEHELFDYICSHDDTEDRPFYAIHISNLEIFDKPRELSEFSVRCPKADAKFDSIKGKMLAYKSLTKAPQNYCYIETGN